jgi:hypothetical protein
MDRQFPRIRFNEELFCPHCGTKLYSSTESIISQCPHLVSTFFWSNDQDFLVNMRSNYAKSFIDAMLISSEYRKHLDGIEMEPLSAREQNLLINGKFEPFDEISNTFAVHFWGPPNDMFPNLLSDDTFIFFSDTYHSGVYFTIDSGE